jgi:hypothetical protein
MNEILLAATMACMSANLAQLAVPRWPLMCMGAPIQRTMDIHAELRCAALHFAQRAF